MLKMNLDIKNCEQCPKHKTNKVYTSDSWDEVREVYCEELKKIVHPYLDWHEESTIPKECPFLDFKEDEVLQLSNNQIEILELFNKKFNWLAMDQNEEIYFYTEKPKKLNEMMWGCDTARISLSLIDLDFLNLNWEDKEPLNWVELLESQV